MSLEEVARQVPETVVREAQRKDYIEAAERVRDRLRLDFPTLKPVSLERCYADLAAAGIATEPKAFRLASEVMARIREELGFSLSGGIGSSALMARMATRMVQPRGLFLLRTGYERSFLKGLPIARIPGIDRSILETLEQFNIRCVGDLSAVSREVLLLTFGEAGGRLHDFALGLDRHPVESRSASEGVSRVATLKEPVFSEGMLFGYASYLMDRGMKEVVAKGLAVRALILHLQYTDGVLKSKRQKLSCPTSHEANLMPVLDRMLRALLTRRLGVVRLGITLDDLTSRNERQGVLFPDPQSDRDDRLHEALHSIRDLHGFDSIHFGSALDIQGEFPECES
jgi:DNA polymerase-4